MAHFLGVPWVKWMKQSPDMQAADVAFYRDYNAMNVATESERAKDMERAAKNKGKRPRGRK